ncbi:hypothetical protein SAMN05444920_118243 [Nonomuraea solani]|uniref:Lipoprotein n=1 Tax=Nonomuraea solani TaxID=1144553 RepID=A0A1H6EWK6_9ACTN|nr:hypothetical protein [Nonomuraea solani]SEH01054.1 hypothetical protein SAMN05444920_118243 [Nonomuraea solani]
MKKAIVLTAAFAALTVAAAPVQAAPKDPVGALKAKMVPGHGVRFTGSVRWTDGTSDQGARDIKGVFQFGGKGVAAYDITMKDGDEQERVIAIGETAYYSGDLVGSRLPDGKTWYKRQSRGMPDSWSQFINPAEPKTLARLLELGKTKGDTVSGSITLKELKAVSAWVSAAKFKREFDGLKISYTLTLSSSGLVSRVTSAYTKPDSGTDYTSTVESGYTGWGSKVSVKAPAPSTVSSKLR